MAFPGQRELPSTEGGDVRHQSLLPGLKHLIVANPHLCPLKPALFPCPSTTEALSPPISHASLLSLNSSSLTPKTSPALWLLHHSLLPALYVSPSLVHLPKPALKRGSSPSSALTTISIGVTSSSRALTQPLQVLLRLHMLKHQVFWESSLLPHPSHYLLFPTAVSNTRLLKAGTRVPPQEIIIARDQMRGVCCCCCYGDLEAWLHP